MTERKPDSRKRGNKIRVNGKFATSKATQRRAAKGLVREKSIPHSIGGHAFAIATQFPGITGSEPLRLAAVASAQMPEIRPAAIKAFRSAEQKAIGEIRQRLIHLSPKSVDYLGELIHGKHESAPHSVRANAALGVIDRALTIADNVNVNNDLVDMSVEDLQEQVNSLGRELASRTAEDADVLKD